MTSTQSSSYPARLAIDYPERLDRLTTAFRLIWAVPIVVILTLLTSGARETVTTEAGEQITTTGGSIAGGLFLAALLMIVFRKSYPRWWFDFTRELTRLLGVVGAYLGLLTDKYPSTTDEQSVHLDLDYPNVEQDLNRWLPLVKWFLAIPHYLVLVVLFVAAMLAIVVAWFAILCHWPLPPCDLRVRRWSWPLEPASERLRVLVDHRPIPTVQPPLSFNG